MKAVFLKMVTGIAFNGGIKTFKYASLFMKCLSRTFLLFNNLHIPDLKEIWTNITAGVLCNYSCFKSFSIVDFIHE